MTKEALKIAGLAIFIFVLVFVLAYGTFFSYSMITIQQANMEKLSETILLMRTQINERSCVPLLEEAGYTVTAPEKEEEEK